MIRSRFEISWVCYFIINIFQTWLTNSQDMLKILQFSRSCCFSTRPNDEKGKYISTISISLRFIFITWLKQHFNTKYFAKNIFALHSFVKKMFVFVAFWRLWYVFWLEESSTEGNLVHVFVCGVAKRVFSFWTWLKCVF